jgi:hypothetical protein
LAAFFVSGPSSGVPSVRRAARRGGFSRQGRACPASVTNPQPFDGKTPGNVAPAREIRSPTQMPVLEKPRQTAETRFVASIYRRAREGDPWAYADPAIRAKKRPAEPESELALALRRAALDE